MSTVSENVPLSATSLPFDESGFASTFAKKIRRSFEIAPKYYAADLPRYLWHRHRLHLPLSDWNALIWNPIREFRRVKFHQPPIPPGYEEALSLFSQHGIRIHMPRQRLEGLLGIWWQTCRVSGEAIECGSYRGTTALLLALLGKMNEVRQVTHMLDTFAGMPKTSIHDPCRTVGEYALPAGHVALIHEQAHALDIEDRIEVHQGLFADTFTRLAPRNLRFSFVHIDANIYQGTLEACQFTLPRMVAGGGAVFDDYNGLWDLGARLAIVQ
jgi:hypothetical protein